MNNNRLEEIHLVGSVVSEVVEVVLVDLMDSMINLDNKVDKELNSSEEEIFSKNLKNSLVEVEIDLGKEEVVNKLKEEKTYL